MNMIIDSEGKLWCGCFEFLSNTKFLDRYLDQESEEPAVILAYGPVARRNRFQEMLYAKAEDMAFTPLPINQNALFTKIPWIGPIICHFHWLNGITKQAETEEQALDAVVRFQSDLALIRKRGGKIIWTVHNILNHVSSWLEQDIQICKIMIEESDLIHIMTSDTVNLCSPYFKLDPKKIFLAPHPSYVGFQVDEIDRTTARKKLNVPLEAFVFLSFGAILPYKGYDSLMSCFDRLSSESESPVHLVVAGLPSDMELAAKIQSWALNRKDVLIDQRPIPEDEVQVFFRASDIAVCPYERTLNSGVAMMAISFDLPVIGPRVGTFADAVGDACGILYPKDRPEMLYDSMKQAAANSLDSLRLGCIVQKKVLAPRNVSEDFFRQIQSRLYGSFSTS